MSTITKEFTKEQLIEKLQHRISVASGFPESEKAQMDLELARIALASLEAEPVAWLLSGGGAKNHVSFDSGNAYADPLREVTPLYTAPPAPVSVPDEVCWEDVPEEITEDDMALASAWAHGFNQCRAAMLQGADGNSPVIPDCSCRTCRPVTFSDSRFVVCPECGNKRCPHANDHRNACSGSNEPGQEGSAYPAAPQQEVAQALAKGMERYGDAMQELAKKEVK
ncbi:hypothetical protein UXO91_18310 [Enterobacter hormaechei]